MGGLEPTVPIPASACLQVQQDGDRLTVRISRSVAAGLVAGGLVGCALGTAALWLRVGGTRAAAPAVGWALGVGLAADVPHEAFGFRPVSVRYDPQARREVVGPGAGGHVVQRFHVIDSASYPADMTSCTESLYEELDGTIAKRRRGARHFAICSSDCAISTAR